MSFTEESDRGLDALIEALTIFRKYANPHSPTTCAHDELWICGITPEEVSSTDTDRLETLGFIIDEDLGAFLSYRFGSA